MNPPAGFIPAARFPQNAPSNKKVIKTCSHIVKGKHRARDADGKHHPFRLM